MIMLILSILFLDLMIPVTYVEEWKLQNYSLLYFVDSIFPSSLSGVEIS